MEYKKLMPRVKAAYVLSGTAFYLRQFSKAVKRNFWRLLFACILSFFFFWKVIDGGDEFLQIATGLPLTYFNSWLTVKLGWVESMAAVKVNWWDNFIFGSLSFPLLLLGTALCCDIIAFIFRIFASPLGSDNYLKKVSDTMKKDGIGKSPVDAYHDAKDAEYRRELDEITAYIKDPLQNYTADPGAGARS